MRSRLTRTCGFPCLTRVNQTQSETTKEEWRRLTSRWRYLHCLFPYLGAPAHTLRRIWLPLGFVLAISVTIKVLGTEQPDPIIWLLGHHTHHLPGSLRNLDETNVTKDVFRATSFVVSLLLAFRINRVYDRWWTGLRAFGAAGTALSSIVRQVAVFSDGDPQLLQQCQQWTITWHYAALQTLTGVPQAPHVQQLLGAEEYAAFTASPKPRNFAGAAVALLVAEHFQGAQQCLLDELVTKVTSEMAAAGRIKLQACPFGLTLYCTGFVWIWLLLVPFGFLPEAGWISGLTCILVASVMTLGLDDLATQMEDPFGFMPLQSMAANTAKDIRQAVLDVQALKALMGGKKAAAGGGGGQQRQQDVDALPVAAHHHQAAAHDQQHGGGDGVLTLQGDTTAVALSISCD